MLSIYDVIVSQKHTMDNESSISLGGTTILLALFAQKLFMGKHILSGSFHTVGHIIVLSGLNVMVPILNNK